MPIRIVTDSTCDLPNEMANAYGITVIPCYVNIGERSYLDGVDLPRQEFYERLPTYSAFPQTAAPGIELFRQTYERLIAEGATEILSIHVSSTLSAVYNVATIAAREVCGATVTPFDSRQLSLGTALQAVTAARAVGASGSVAEGIALLRDQIARTHSYAILDTLEYLRRGGRVSRLIAGLGLVLQIKPLFKIYDGEVTVEKTRTRKGALVRLMNLVQELGALEQVAIVHAHCPDRAAELRQCVQQIHPCLGISLCVEVTPVVGAHFGPGMVGLVCIQSS